MLYLWNLSKYFGRPTMYVTGKATLPIRTFS